MKRLEWFIARRYLASRRKGKFLSLITVIAVGGVFLGVMALITVISVMTGLQQDLQAKIIGTNPHVYVFQQAGNGFRMTDWRPVVDSLQRVPGIVGLQPFVMTQVAVMGANPTSGMLYGLQMDSQSEPVNDIEARILSGQYKLGTTQSQLPPILVGERLAQRLIVRPGDVLTIASLENIKTGSLGELVPVVRKFEVTDTFRTGMYEYDSEFMYTTLAAAQDLLSMDSVAVSGVAVKVDQPWKVEGVRANIDGRLGFGYYTEDWMRLNGPLFEALKLEKLAMMVILFLIVLVAAFNIISTLIMVVADKTREIGILKSMGLTDGGVLRIFVLQGVTIGTVGTLLGVAGGLALTWVIDTFKLISLPGDVYFIDRLPLELQPLDLALIIVSSLLIAFTATIYPARQASKLLPVEAIRHE